MDNFSEDITAELLRYSDNEMSSNEKTAFEERLKQDRELAERLEEFDDAKKAVILYGIREQVKKVRTEMSTAHKPVKIINSGRRFVLLRIAAAAAIVVGLFFVINKYTSSNSAESLYAAQFIVYEPQQSRGAGEVASTFTAAYRAADYAGVTEMYQSTPTPDQQQMLLAGIAYLELNKTQDAINSLLALQQKNISESSNRYNDDATFYLALAYLKNKNYAKAADLMEKIAADKNNPYASRFSATYIQHVKDL